MPNALPRYATTSFIHSDPVAGVEVPIHKGHEYELHDPAVEARPDLFTTEPPKPAKAEKHKEA